MKAFLILLLTVVVSFAGNPEAEIIAELTNRDKLATLPTDGKRRANDRLLKALAQMSDAHARLGDPAGVVYEAMLLNGENGKRGELVAESLIKNYTYALRLSLFTPGNLNNMRHGKSPVLSNGDKVEVDHIIPIAHYPEYENEFINLQLLPASIHDSKGKQMTAEALELLPVLKSLQNQSSASGVQAAPPPPEQAPPKFIYKRHTLETGKPLNLSKYGGENTDIAIHSRDLGYINISAVYYEKTIQKLNRSGDIITVPETFSGQLQKTKLRKFPSKEFEGDLYELFTDRTGIRVFYNDSTFTPINHHELILEIPNN